MSALGCCSTCDTRNERKVCIARDGVMVGNGEGSTDGLFDGVDSGLEVLPTVGTSLGCTVGSLVGTLEGSTVHAMEGTGE